VTGFFRPYGKKRDEKISEIIRKNKTSRFREKRESWEKRGGGGRKKGIKQTVDTKDDLPFKGEHQGSSKPYELCRSQRQGEKKIRKSGKTSNNPESEFDLSKNGFQNLEKKSGGPTSGN